MNLICVGAVDRQYRTPRFSNHGEVVEIAAPGSNVEVANGGILPNQPEVSKKGTKILSGTSLAAPHVAGIAALYVSSEGLHRTFDDSRTVKERILDNALEKVIKGWQSRPIVRLANTGVMRVEPDSDLPVSRYLLDVASLSVIHTDVVVNSTWCRRYSRRPQRIRPAFSTLPVPMC